MTECCGLLGLEFAELYEFWIVAHTIIGEGARSKVVSARPIQDGNNLTISSHNISNTLLSITAPATITSFSASIHYPYSQSVSLPCSTVGRPPPRLTWIVNDKLVTSDKNYQVQWRLGCPLYDRWTRIMP